ncbi:MAG TPA: DUF3800 domain-containing protein [Candidatus Elarobacter sp.]|nr:DUF3800 domain-containing protein [Candidatus Elarobacter sp.]
MLAFYADESGSFDLHSAQPWVVLLAIGFDDDHWLRIDRGVNDLKQAYFGQRHPHEIEIRSNDLRMAHVRPRPGNPFSLFDLEALRSFGNDLYALIDALPFAWCASVVHGPTAMRADSLRGSYDLFALSYRTLLGQLDRWCALTGEPGRLFLDQRDPNLHGRAHRTIIAMHDDCRRQGSPRQPHVIERPYFHDSARSNHIQLADIIAYNVLRRFRNGDPRYPYYVRIRSKLRRFGEASAGGLIVYAPGGLEHDESGSDWVPPGSRQHDSGPE